MFVGQRMNFGTVRARITRVISASDADVRFDGDHKNEWRVSTRPTWRGLILLTRKDAA